MIASGSGSGTNEVGSPRRARQRTCAPVPFSLGRERPSKVRCLTEFYRAIDFGYVGFTLAWVASFAVVLRLAFERAL